MDDLVPNEGGSSIFQGDPETQKEVNQEKHDTVATGKPLVQKLLDFLDGEIAWANTIEGFDAESEVQMKAQLLAKQRYMNMIRGRKEYLESLLNEHLPEN